MSIDIFTIGKKVVIEIPLKKERSNPYTEQSEGEMDNIIGLIESNGDMGFCFRIDMSYKGKPDQWTDYFYKHFGTKEEFLVICKQLGIDVVYS